VTESWFTGGPCPSLPHSDPASEKCAKRDKFTLTDAVGPSHSPKLLLRDQSVIEG